jgi:hypothetical protein
METDKKTIKLSKLLLCEGKDDFCFFGAFLKHLKLEDKIQPIEYGGKNKLSSFLKTLQVDEKFPSVVSIGITRDADNNFDGARASVDNSVQSSKFSAETTVSKFILPDNKNIGALEALCLDAIRQTTPAVWTCIEKFAECLSSSECCDCVPTLPPNKQDKRLIHAWLSSLPEPDLTLGIAAQKKRIPFDAPVFGQLAEFLKQI